MADRILANDPLNLPRPLDLGLSCGTSGCRAFHPTRSWVVVLLHQQRVGRAAEAIAVTTVPRQAWPRTLHPFPGMLFIGGPVVIDS